MRTIAEMLLRLEQELNQGAEINGKILSSELEQTINFYFKIAKNLTCQDRMKAYDRIAAECYWGRDEVGRITGYDEKASFGIFMAERDSYYVKNKDKVLRITEALKRRRDALLRSYMVEVANGFGEPPLEAVEQSVYGVWRMEYIKEHHSGLVSILDVLLTGAGRAEDKRDDDYFEYDFLVRAGVCVAEKTVMPKVFSDFIDCKDKKIAALLTTRISSCTTPKSIAITLIAMSKLKYINIDKINRRELYGAIRRMTGVKFNDNSINYYICQLLAETMPDNMVDAIKNEISVIENLLVKFGDQV